MGQLSGFCIGVTADRRSGEQIQMLESRGAECIHGPMLRTHALGPQRDVAVATESVIECPPDITILNTGIGVRGWFAAADSLLLGESLHHALGSSHIVSRGPKACGAAVTAGLRVDWNAATATSGEVISYLADRQVRGQTVALQLDGDLSGDFAKRIEELGARVIEVPVYRWTSPDDRPAAENLISAVCDRRLDAITFTARPAVTNFARITDEMGRFPEVVETLAQHTRVYSLGPTTAAALHQLGLGDSESPERSRLGALVMHLTDSLSDRAQDLSIAGHQVRFQGRLVVVGDSTSEYLTGREKQLLEVLVRRPGVVHSKSSLLAEIWGEDSPDGHVVEVTVGRLRRRLGPAGVGVETVMRRGYRVSAA